MKTRVSPKYFANDVAWPLQALMLQLSLSVQLLLGIYPEQHFIIANLAPKFYVCICFEV